MAQAKKVTKKQVIGFLLAHPIKTTKILIALKKSSDIDLIAVWYYANEEIKKRGIK